MAICIDLVSLGAEVFFMPWLDLSDHKGVCKPVKILSDSCVRDTKGPGKLGRVPYLAMIMGQHVPESAQPG